MTDTTGADLPGQPRRVAIACQGGGSHTAFTAGVLSRLFDGLEPDGELTSTAPFRPRDGLRGGDARTEVADLCTAVRLDLSRKQLTRERATWTVRLEGEADQEAEIVDGVVTALRMGPA